RLQVDAAEHDARVHRRRAQGEKDLLAAVQADAGGADHVLEGALGEHGRSARLPPGKLNKAVGAALGAATRGVMAGRGVAARAPLLHPSRSVRLAAEEGRDVQVAAVVAEVR